MYYFPIRPTLWDHGTLGPVPKTSSAQGGRDGRDHGRRELQFVASAEGQRRAHLRRVPGAGPRAPRRLAPALRQRAVRPTDLPALLALPGARVRDPAGGEARRPPARVPERPQLPGLADQPRRPQVQGERRLRHQRVLLLPGAQVRERVCQMAAEAQEEDGQAVLRPRRGPRRAAGQL